MAFDDLSIEFLPIQLASEFHACSVGSRCSWCFVAIEWAKFTGKEVNNLILRVYFLKETIELVVVRARLINLSTDLSTSRWLMMLSLYFSALNCSQPLGMEDGTILNRQISASSERRVDFGPANARLNFSGPGAWVAGTQDDNQWLQVDFGNETRVTEIDTQGRRCGKCHQWVKEYTVSYSKDNVTFKRYKEDGQCQVKVFRTGVFP